MTDTERRRAKACQFAATLMADELRDDGDWVARLWSATVFFERYMELGADGTRKDFGPKRPRKLKLAEG